MEIGDGSFLIGEKIDKYRIEDKLGEGTYGVTFKAIDTKIGTTVAIKVLKFVTQDDTWIEEARKAALVKNCPFVVRPIDFDEKNLVINGQNVVVRYLVWEYVNDNGVTLKKFLEEQPNVTIDFIIEVCSQLCRGIKAIFEGGIEHGDLHEGNIILIPPPTWDPLARYLIKIVDFGLAESMRGKSNPDIISLSKIISNLWSISKEYENEMIWYDKKFLTDLPILISQMSDENPERRINDPVIIINRINEMKQNSRIASSPKIRKLEDPFAYLNVEEIPEDSDLLSYLFADSLPWYKDITNFGTMVISGHRGSGKSMLLKNMRFKTKLMSENGIDNVLEDSYLGFYIHCTHNFYVPFAGKNIKYNELNLDMILHLFNLLLTHEILDSLIQLNELTKIKLSDSAQKILYDFINNYIEKSSILIGNVDILEHIITLLRREIRLIQKYIVETKTIKNFTGVNYLKDLFLLLDEICPLFNNKKVYILLDDYSDARGINKNIQKSINRLVGFRNDKFCFKITTERYAFWPIDLDDNVFSQDREFRYVDLGQQFLSYTNKLEEKHFIKTILNKRLKISDVNKDIELLFGNYIFPDGNIGRSLGNPKTRKNTLYAGFDTICNLCSGDIASLLELCREIYRESIFTGKYRKENEEHIDFKLQDSIIRGFSRNRLAMIRDIQDYGETLYEIAYSMGEISRKYLYEYGEIASKSHVLSRYQEIIRIEVEGIKKLEDDVAPIYKALIKHGIFTDAGTGYPWGEKIHNIRLIFRKIYVPAFLISYRNRECLRMSPHRFEIFLKNPDIYAKRGTKFLDSLSQPTLYDIDKHEK